MSVLLPWKRTTNSGGQRHPLKKELTPIKRGTRTPVRRALLSIGLMCAIMVFAHAIRDFAASLAVLGSHRIWEAESLFTFVGEYALAQTAGASEFVSKSGTVARLPQPIREAVISGDRLYAIAGGDLLTCDSGGNVSRIDRVSPGERLVACRGYPNALLQRPQSSGKFGEPWILRAVTPKGASLWEAILPGIAGVAAASGRYLCVGLHDISAGGALNLAMIDASTGKSSWVRSAGHGAWRGLAISPTGDVAYATSAKAALVDAAGTEAWSREPGGVIGALALGKEAVVIAHDSPGYPIIETFSSRGAHLWQARLPSAAHSVEVLGTRAVALCQNHVIGFSLEDGKRETYLPTRDLPLAITGETLTLRGPSGAYLLKTEMNEGN